LNFIPSMATMIFGLMAGELLRTTASGQRKFWLLVGASVVCLAVGQMADWWVVPSVKRIWTPSWAVYSSGWTLVMLAAFYGVIDLGGWKAWTFPLVVVGMNSIAIYLMSQLMRGFVRQSLHTHLGAALFAGPFGPTLELTLILVVFWLICWWMYRK